MRRIRGVSLIALAFVVSALTAVAWGQPADQEQVPGDFERRVRPIFEKHCLGCHGPYDQRNGLRLDSLKEAQRGGDSRRPILGGTLETNEIYRRVSSTESAYRMPKRNERLSDSEIDAIREWVLAGCFWPENESTRASSKGLARISGGPRLVRTWRDFMSDLFDWLERNPYVFGFCWLALPALLLMFASQDARRRQKSGQGLGRFSRFLASFTYREIVCGWAMMGSLFAAFEMRVERDAAMEEVEDLKTMPPGASSSLLRIGQVAKGGLYRLSHPKALRRTYYRGNCERNPQLFNSGNYLTATFQISLRTADGVELEYGQPLPEGELFVHFELNRAPGTTPLLFSEDMMAGIFLTEAVGNPKPSVVGPPHYSLHTLNPENRWTCDVPVKAIAQEEWINGVIYVKKGRAGELDAGGETHYGIKYELHVQEGLIQSDSDIWMGCLFTMTQVQPQPPTDMIPFCEWFDWRPLPEINGPNSTDPKLLGVPER